MSTTATYLSLFVLALQVNDASACVGSYPNKCCISGNCNVGIKGSTWPEAACPGGLCKGNPLCPDYVAGGKKDYSPCLTAGFPTPTPSTSAPATAPAPAPARALAAAADSNDSCPAWAGDGQCVSNPEYMLSNCALSCSALDTASTAASTAPVTASDSIPSCATWAAQGQCVANSAYMLTNCALSCEGQSEGQSSTAPAINPVVATCDQKNVDYSSRQNCCRCERQDAAQPRWLRGARKLGLIGATVGATASVATAAADTTIAANSAYSSQLPCC